jgi:hypothetical protein
MWRLKPKISMQKLGQTKTGSMNETEKTYAWILEGRKERKEIIDYWYERFKLRLADDCWYVVDFMVILPDGVMQIHEVKGEYIREDAIIKLKGIAEVFPFEVFMAQWKRKDKAFTISKVGR